MAYLNLNSVIFFTVIRIYFATRTNEKEYCAGDSFNPRCQSGELILMQSALFGRMRLGQCLQTDVGFMGCQTDVLSQLDLECSGKESCDVLVMNLQSNTQGGCLKELSSYLEAQYICVKGLEKDVQCESNQRSTIETNESEFFVSDLQLQQTCPSQNNGISINVKDGQVMNISLINLQHKINSDDIYGTFEDLTTGKRVVFGDGPRESHLLLSSSNNLELRLSETANDRNRFMLHVTVLGCPNMPPPDGAWMTRNGNIMEIGCHTGAKTWSLRCQENQWVGAVGQCGEAPSAVNENRPTARAVNSKKLSINAMLFGICSLIIFLSAVSFLTGVCLLKRKLQLPLSSLPAEQKAFAQLMPHEIVSENFHTMPQGFPTQREMYPVHGVKMEPGYKSLLLAQGAIVENTGRAKGNQNESPPAYMNTTGSDASDSVKYYVLEDTATKQ